MTYNEKNNTGEQTVNVCFFPSILGKGENKPIADIIEDIKNGRWQNSIEEIRNANNEGNTILTDLLKRRLPAFTPSGEFNGKHNLNSLVKYNPIIIIDFDHVENNKMDQLRKTVEENQHTWISFISPRGEGLKVFVKVDSMADEHEHAFNQVIPYYENLTGQKADHKNKDISRLCFVSYDPDVYRNNDSTIFEIKRQTKEDQDYQIFKKAENFTKRKETYTEGNRNNFVHLLACNCNRYGLNEQKTLSLILDNYKGLPEQEIKSTVQSAFNNTDDHGTYDYVTTITQETISFDTSSNTMVCSVFELIDRNESEPEHSFIWNGIKEATFGYVYGPPKSGKTVFCENLGMSIAAGNESFLGFSIDQSKDRKVLFIGMEEFWRNRASRNKKQVEALSIANPEEFKYFVVNEHFPGRLATEEDWMKVESIIRIHKPDIVFIDSMTRTVNGEIEDSSTSRDTSFKLRELVRKYGITLIMIHHTTKLHGNPLDLDKLAGSRVIAQEADFLYGINRSEGMHYIKEVATRYKAENEKVTTFNINENLWLEKVDDTHENYFITPADGRENPANEQLILDTIREKVTDDKPTVSPKEVMEGIGGAVEQTQFYSYLKKLEAKGKIKRGRGEITLTS